MRRRPVLEPVGVAKRRRSAATPSTSVPTVLLFLKAPRRGEVKTRLAATIGTAAATQLYREMAERQLAAVPSHWRLDVCYAPRGARREMAGWLGARVRLRVQRGEGLGPRLAAAFRTAFERGSARVIAIGADCPDLDAACLDAASCALDTSDVVLGPATDGGYYLIGMRRNLPRLFAEIPWSSAGVLQATLARARELDVSVRLLGEKEDIDDFDSLQRFRRQQNFTPKPGER